jgi:predicted ArsR family transcriptional regulator
MTETTDRPLLDRLRKSGPQTIAELSEYLGVTATAVRHRLARVVSLGLVERALEHGGRGRPKHRYQLTEVAHRRLDQNYAELACVLWDELMRDVPDRKLRRHLFLRITDKLAELFRSEVRGVAYEDRLVELGSALSGRGIEAEVARREGSSEPFLRQYSCPYYALAESDPAICALERKMFEKVLGKSLRLSQCRLDGHHSCDFEVKPTVEGKRAV